jgi:capsular exopolysaccharide synthesis family protein
MKAVHLARGSGSNGAARSTPGPASGVAAGTAGEPASELVDYFSMFWRRKWLMLLIVVLVVGLAVAYSSQQTKVYQSRASVLVKFVNLQPTRGSDNGLINMEPERGLATSAEVAALAAKKTGPLAAPATISVNAPDNANTLEITASSRSPEAAQAMAQATAESYLKVRADTVLRNVQNARDPLEEKLQEVNDQFASTYQQLLAAQNDSQRSGFSVKLSQLSAQASALESRLLDYITPDSVDSGTILTNAQLPGSPARPKPFKTGILALFVGVGLAVAIAMLRDRLDRRVRRTDDIEVGTRAPVLAVVPAETSLRRPLQRSITVGPETDYTRAFRTLRATIEFIVANDAVKSILVTSPNQGDGKTTTVANLAVSLARGGRRVVMVSADLQRQDLRAHFDVAPGLGLTTALAGEQEPTSLLTRVADNLYLLDVGPTWEVASELLGSPRMAKLIADLETFGDVVLIDAPSVLASADAVTVAPLADATLLVVDADRVTMSDLSAARYRLEQVGVTVIGAVLNNVDRSRFRPNSILQPSGALPATANWSA